MEAVFNLHQTSRPRPKGILLKARVTLCPGSERARDPIPLLPRRYQAPFCLRDLPQPWTPTVPESPLGPPQRFPAGRIQATHSSPLQELQQLYEELLGYGVQGRKSSTLDLQGLCPSLSTDNDETVKGAFLLLGLCSHSPLGLCCGREVGQQLTRNQEKGLGQTDRPWDRQTLGRRHSPRRGGGGAACDRPQHLLTIAAAYCLNLFTEADSEEDMRGLI